MELYFLDDQPRIIYHSKKYARVRQNVVEHKYGIADICYVCDANSYNEAMERLLFQSAQVKKEALDGSFARGLNAAVATIIDPLRGDGFAFLMMPLSEWAEMLEGYTTPEEYK